MSDTNGAIKVDIVFCDPPRKRGNQQGGPGKYDDALSKLKKHKNKWARVTITNSPRQASSLLSVVKNTPRYRNLALPGKFDVVTRRLDDDDTGNKRYGVWMRWVPK